VLNNEKTPLIQPLSQRASDASAIIVSIGILIFCIVASVSLFLLTLEVVGP
jgi:hypothetical protein